MASNLPTDPVPDSNAALWLAIGRLQSDVARLIEGQAEIRTDMAESNRQTNQRQAELRTALAESNRRIDRLFYALIGVGAGVIGTLVAVLLRSG